jgi:hypothetical protein
MATDKELLELAAKAAGIELRPMEIKNVDEPGMRFIGYITNAQQWPRGWFNPLTDDGDALRLAVQLDLTINSASIGTMATLPTPIGDCAGHIEMIDEIDDKLVATRRAITRAAAEIGRNMK